MGFTAKFTPQVFVQKNVSQFLLFSLKLMIYLTSVGFVISTEFVKIHPYKFQ